MIRVLAVATLSVFAASSLVSCGSTDLVIDENRSDIDIIDVDDGGSDDDGDAPHVLAPPTLSIEVYNVTSTTVQLAWTHDEPAGCCTFRVYYGVASNGPFTAFGEVSAPPRITGLTADTLYFFYVTAVQNGVESAPSLTRPALTKAGIAPNFRVARVGGGGAVLAWDAVPGASGFNVYRSEPGSTVVTDASEVVQVDGYASSAVFDGLASSTTYAFKIAVEKGEFRFGDLSEAVSGTTTEPMTVTSFTPDYGFDDQTVTITGQRFGTDLADIAVIFEGEVGPSDERTGPALTVTDTTVTAKVPAGAASGPISVRRVLYSKATSTAAYEVGDLLAFGRVAVGPTATAPRITSLHAASATHVLAGRIDGVLLRSTNGASFTALDYSAALTDATDCSDAPGDTSSGVLLSSIQCVADDCLVARSVTCNALRLGATFGATPTVTRKRIGPATGPAIGPTQYLACGNATDATGCLSVVKNGSTLTMAYTTSFLSEDFAAVTPALPTGSDFAYRSLRGRAASNDVVLLGTGTGTQPNRTEGLLVGSRPFTSFALVADAPGEAYGGDCASSDDGNYCVVAAGEQGLTHGTGASTTSLTFTPATTLPAGATFYDAQCTSYQHCIAVGGVDETLTTERGLVAQTNDGLRWFYRYVGTLTLRAVSCAGGTCFAGNRGGDIYRGN